MPSAVRASSMRSRASSFARTRSRPQSCARSQARSAAATSRRAPARRRSASLRSASRCSPFARSPPPLPPGAKVVPDSRLRVVWSCAFSARWAERRSRTWLVSSSWAAPRASSVARFSSYSMRPRAALASASHRPVWSSVTRTVLQASSSRWCTSRVSPHARSHAAPAVPGGSSPGPARLKGDHPAAAAWGWALPAASRMATTR